jgi:hypothetical protein
MFYALASGDTKPLAKSLAATKPRPATAQWGLFLRNHDELDLGRLTKAQREKVFKAFGPDKGMQLYDRGIRRRLAPMLGGDRRRLELAYSLMCTLPGTPVIRYGDEIEATTWIADFRRVRSRRDYVVHAGERRVAHASTDWVFVDGATLRPRRIDHGRRGRQHNLGNRLRLPNRQCGSHHRGDLDHAHRLGAQCGSGRKIRSHQLNAFCNLGGDVGSGNGDRRKQGQHCAFQQVAHRKRLPAWLAGA